MKVGDLVRKFTSIEGVYQYGIVLEVSGTHNISALTAKVAWTNSNPKNPWMMAKHLEVVNESR